MNIQSMEYPSVEQTMRQTALKYAIDIQTSEQGYSLDSDELISYADDLYKFLKDGKVPETND